MSFLWQHVSPSIIPFYDNITSGRNEVAETSGRVHPLWPQNKWLHTPRNTDYRHTRPDGWIQRELAFTLAKNATKRNPFEIIPLQTTRKENNWKIKEALARAAVTLETERIGSKGPILDVYYDDDDDDNITCSSICLIDIYQVNVFLISYVTLMRRSQWPHGLSCESAADSLLGLWVRIPPGTWMSVFCKCCGLSGRSLCVGLITFRQDSYRVGRVSGWSLDHEDVLAHYGLLSHGKKKKIGLYDGNYVGSDSNIQPKWCSYC